MLVLPLKSSPIGEILETTYQVSYVTSLQAVATKQYFNLNKHIRLMFMLLFS